MTNRTECVIIHVTEKFVNNGIIKFVIDGIIYIIYNYTAVDKFFAKYWYRTYRIYVIVIMNITEPQDMARQGQIIDKIKGLESGLSLLFGCLTKEFLDQCYDGRLLTDKLR